MARTHVPSAPPRAPRVRPAAPDAPRQVVAGLLREHDEMQRLLAAVESQLAAVASGRDADDDLMRDALAYLGEFVQGFHHAKEELAVAVVAPQIAELRALEPELRQQHARIRECAEALAQGLGRALLDEPMRRDELASAGFAYTRELRGNMSFEEARVFPELARGLDGTAWATIESRIGAVPDGLFGEAARRRRAAVFRVLAHRFGIDACS